MRGDKGMNERRKFNRWEINDDKKVKIITADFSEEARLINISAGGMKAIFSRPLEIGSLVQGEISILPKGGPFYGVGKVLRLQQREKNWQVAVKFDKVSTLPFKNMRLGIKDNWRRFLKRIFSLDKF